MENKILDAKGRLSVACCQFMYKGYEVSYTQICKPFEVVIFSGPYISDKVAGPFHSIEYAIKYIDSLVK